MLKKAAATVMAAVRLGEAAKSAAAELAAPEAKAAAAAAAVEDSAEDGAAAAAEDEAEDGGAAAAAEDEAEDGGAAAVVAALKEDSNVYDKSKVADLKEVRLSLTPFFWSGLPCILQPTSPHIAPHRPRIAPCEVRGVAALVAVLIARADRRLDNALQVLETLGLDTKGKKTQLLTRIKAHAKTL